MASRGMAIMLQSMGIDPEKIKADIEGMKQMVTKTLNEINAKLTLLDERQALILKLTEELTAWKRQQVNRQLAQLAPSAQSPAQLQPMTPQERPSLPEAQPNPQLPQLPV